MPHLFHALDRPNQLKTAQDILKNIQNNVPIQVLCAGTGFGKTAIPAFLADQGLKVLAVVKTKSLQVQYENYGAVSILGKANYLCNGYNFKKQKTRTCDMCNVTINSKFKSKCDRNCAYPLKRNEFINAQFGVTNYSKFFHVKPLIDKFKPDIIILDEGHEISEMIIDHVGLNFSFDKWDTNYLSYYTEPINIQIDTSIVPTQRHINTVNKGKEWLENLVDEMGKNQPSKNDEQHFKWWRMKKWQYNLTLNYMDIMPDCWFVRANNEEMTIKPLTSIFHTINNIQLAPSILMMSATMTYKNMSSMGIKDFEFINVPHNIPARDRVVHEIDAPILTRKSTYQDEIKHAEIIAGIFRKREGANGILHRASYAKCERLAEFLHNMISNPLWIPEQNMDTSDQREQWEQFDKENKGAICISPNFTTGVDLPNIKINLICDRFWPYFGDEFIKTKHNYDKTITNLNIATIVQQAMGRIHRAREDYYNKKKYRGIVGKFKGKRITKYFIEDFKQSLRTG